MEPDHDPTMVGDTPAPTSATEWTPPDAPASVTPLFTEQPHEGHPERLARFLREADDLADACSELITSMRTYTAMAPVTERLVDAHAMLVTAANTLATIR